MRHLSTLPQATWGAFQTGPRQVMWGAFMGNYGLAIIMASP